MNKYDLSDKAIILAGCTALSLVNPLGIWHVVPVLLSVIFTGLITIFDKKVFTGIFTALFAIICLVYEPMNLFLPVIAYSSYSRERWYLSATLLIPLATAHEMQLFLRVALLVLLLIAVMLKHRTSEHETLKSHYIGLLDTTRNMTREMKEQNKHLLINQDDKIRLAMLNERGRISREIHDHVGHKLSSALLQIGAIFAGRNSQDPALLELRETLSAAMDSIRKSVHDIHDSSVDLHAQIDEISGKLICCEVEKAINLHSDPDAKIKYALISTLKEAFSNIARHSDATKVKLFLNEHPAFYQMIISDNGSRMPVNIDNGIGIKSISARIEALRGQFLIRTQTGFEIFITIPKEVR